MASSEVRDHLGDKPPEITRKITACVACRKQKIRCHMQDGKAPCTRCRKRGLPCTVNKSLQTILQNDVLWKHAVEKKLDRFQDHFDRLALRLSIPELAADVDDEGRHLLLDDTNDQIDGDTSMQLSSEQESNGRPIRSRPRATNTVEQAAADDQEPHVWEVLMTSGPGAIPGSVVNPVTTIDQNSKMKPDVVSRNIITAEEAQEFLDVYHKRLDHFVYRILGDNKTLTQIRSSSSLLLAAICAVGSLHNASPHFDRLYQEFVALASAQSFSRRLNTDDVRALCIGAFWLSGISWACVANAVRISTEIQLQRSIHKAIEGERAHYLRTRLYYLVFVCDHHFSIPYGRPPMTPSDESIRANPQFLESRYAVEDDARLVSQLRLWQVLANVHLTLGGDIDRPLTSTMLDPIRRLGMDIDGIRLDWSDRFVPNQHVKNYPRKGVTLHCHFAKLFLYCHAFRGINSAKYRPAAIALEVDELANAALLSATSILQIITSDPEMQEHLNGLPTYFDLMIASAVVFLLKVSSSYAENVRVDISKVSMLVAELVAVLKTITSTMHPRHILASVARGAESLLLKCDAAATGRSGPPSGSVNSLEQQYLDQSFYDVPVNWSDMMTLDNFSMTEFDFVADQVAYGGS